jgi:hypothetical protein
MNIFQIGTCKGNDDVTKLVEQNAPNLLVLVEPNSFHNNDILKCYEGVNNVHLENIVITNNPNQDKAYFYYHKNDGPLYEVASLDIYHILKHGYDYNGIVVKEIQAITAEQLFEKYGCIDIDILFVDAEGFDDAIIRSINLNKYNIKKIYYENLHLKSNLDQYLQANGYNITTHIGYNGWSNMAIKEN